MTSRNRYSGAGSTGSTSKTTKSKKADLNDDWFGSGDSAVSSGSWSQPAKCHNSHKELTIGTAPGVILGASCNDPRPGYDIYVGFDWGMRMPFPQAPWDKTKGEPDPAIYAKFEIPDMQAPTKARTAEFKRMIDWLEEQLHAGKRIHIGCIGGHGRTGLVLAALVKQMTGEEDATTWVRTHHCKKGVESQAQIDFLFDHYGVKKVGGSKNWDASSLNYGSSKGKASTVPSAEQRAQGGGMGFSGKSGTGRAVGKDEFASQRPQTTADVWADGKRLTALGDTSMSAVLKPY